MNLEHLSLSISEDANDRAFMQASMRDTAFGPDERSSYLLFEDVCEGYRRFPERPLALRTLRLGERIHFPQLDILRGVVNTTTLQDIFIYNGFVPLPLQSFRA